MVLKFECYVSVRTSLTMSRRCILFYDRHADLFFRCRKLQERFFKQIFGNHAKNKLLY